MSHLIPDWKDAATRYYSTWALYLLLGLPELLPLLAPVLGFSMDEPTLLVRLMQAITAAGIIGRFVDQHRPPSPPGAKP